MSNLANLVNELTAALESETAWAVQYKAERDRLADLLECERRYSAGRPAPTRRPPRARRPAVCLRGVFNADLRGVRARGRVRRGGDGRGQVAGGGGGVIHLRTRLYFSDGEALYLRFEDRGQALEVAEQLIRAARNPREPFECDLLLPAGPLFDPDAEEVPS